MYVRACVTVYYRGLVICLPPEVLDRRIRCLSSFSVCNSESSVLTSSPAAHTRPDIIPLQLSRCIDSCCALYNIRVLYGAVIVRFSINVAQLLSSRTTADRRHEPTHEQNNIQLSYPINKPPEDDVSHLFVYYRKRGGEKNR